MHVNSSNEHKWIIFTFTETTLKAYTYVGSNSAATLYNKDQ